MKYLDKGINDCGDCWPITPITLATEDFDLQSESHYTALGWGAFDDTRQPSKYLRQVELTLNYDMTQEYFLLTNVGPVGQDTCAGDSGILQYSIVHSTLQYSIVHYNSTVHYSTT